ncbi:MAG: lipopolysaccharide heptosyltransferase II [Verrucomicrobiota bacterium]|nr:lipopolysaccharide heptosyltransferase II [Limisphaerales bacterium]
MKILILKPSSLGDVVQALPVLRLLKRHCPASEIHWWIDAGLAPLLEGDPDLAGVVRFERQRWAAPVHWPEMLRSIAALRAQQFDWVIDLQGLARSGAFAWLANGELLVGLDESREGARGFYDIIVPRPSFHTHAVDWYLAVLPRLGVPVHSDFVWLPERPAATAAVQSKWPADCARWIALQPGARWLNKRWPAEHFAELTRQLGAEFPDVRFAILGSAEDQPLGEIIARAAPERCLNLAGRTSLPEMIEWLRRCELMVTNDTGPMHVAAALGKPVIALCGPTEPRRTGPYGQWERVAQTKLPCVPCLKSRCAWPQPMECLTALAPREVLARARRELARRG